MTKIFALAALFFSLAPAAHGLEPMELNGEKLRMRVFWSGIPAAEVTLSTQVVSRELIRFTINARSLPGVSLVYPLETEIVSTVSLPAFQPLLYTKSGQEGWGNTHERKVTFDYQTNKSSYELDGKPKKSLDISPGVQDPLSCLYYYRLSGAAEKEKVLMRIVDGNKFSESAVTVVGREKITVPAGTFDTIVVKPNMENVGGVFAKSPGAPLHIWLTDDARLMPVMLRSKVRVGEFTAELEHYDPPMIHPPGKR